MHGLGAVSLRYFNVAGADRDRACRWLGERHDPETHLIPQCPGPPRLGGGEAGDLRRGLPDSRRNLRQGLHPRRGPPRAAHLLALAACRPARHVVYNLGSGAGYSNFEVLAACRTVTGRAIPSLVARAGRRPGDPGRFLRTRPAQTELGWVPVKQDLRRYRPATPGSSTSHVH